MLRQMQLQQLLLLLLLLPLASRAQSDDCGELTLSRGGGAIASHASFGRSPYAANASCEWTINATDSGPVTVVIGWLQLADGDCLNIERSDGQSLASVCNASRSALTLPPQKDNLVVRFQSDDAMQAEGFVITFVTCPSCIPMRECEENVCMNGGECFRDNSSFRCRCAEGYEGILCQKNAMTTESTISDAMTTESTIADAMTTAGSTETDEMTTAGSTETDEMTTTEMEGTTAMRTTPKPTPELCQINVCVNGGTCIRVEHGFACLCPPGYRGFLCRENIDDCSPDPCRNGSTCVDGIADYTCRCAAGFAGKNCTEPVVGTTMAPTTPRPLERCAVNLCFNGGTCYRVPDHPLRVFCRCAPGFRGLLCLTNINDCWPNPCMNGARCVDGVNNYTCECADGFAGRHCDMLQPTTPMPTTSTPGERMCDRNICRNGGTCIIEDDGLTCRCPVGFGGFLCMNNFDDCSPNPCQNGGRCVDGAANYTCECAAGFGGRNCSLVVPTPTPEPQCIVNICRNGATCYLKHNGKSACRCAPGFQGHFCQVNINDCSPNPCDNGGRCTDLVNNYTCECAYGFAGRNCDMPITTPTVNVTTPGEQMCSINVCENGATCIIEPDGILCRCALGYGGFLCMNNIDDCSPNPCQNGATCVDGIANYTCQCAGGYTGANCSIPPEPPRCPVNPCLNGGTCYLGQSSAFMYCSCAPGFNCTICQRSTDDCTPNPCQNGGVCIDGFNNYTCVCPPSWMGRDCANDICSSVRCGTNEVCTRASNTTVRCSCRPGYYRRNGNCIRSVILSTINASVVAEFSLNGLSVLLLPLTQPVLIDSVSSLYARVGINGYISLSEQPLAFTYPRSNRLSPLVFPMWASLQKMRLSSESNITYEVLTEPGSENWMAAVDIIANFTRAEFNATEIVIVTWLRMRITSPYDTFYDLMCSTLCGKSWCTSDLCIHCRLCERDHVSFQMLMIRNGSHAYLVWNYGETRLQRSSSLFFLAGYTDAKSPIMFWPFSNKFVTAALMPNLRSVTGGVLGRFVATSAVNVAPGDAEICAAWLRRSDTRLSLRCDRCPTNHRQALFDWRYRLYSIECDASDDRSAPIACYRGRPSCVRRQDGKCKLYLRHQCCYRLRRLRRRSFSALREAICNASLSSIWRLARTFRRSRRAVSGPMIRSMPKGAAVGHISSTSQWEDEEELNGHRVCYRAGMYKQLRRVRPRCRSRRYRRIRWGWFRGDPHFTTLDGTFYTFNGHCEYIMVQNSTSDVPLLQVQTRTGLAVVPSNNKTTNATVFTGFAMRLGSNSESVAVLLNREIADIQVYVGSRLLGAVRTELVDNLTTTGTYTIISSDGSVLISESETGFSVNVSMAVNFLQAAFQVPADYNGKVEGLLGNYNGNGGDDFRMRSSGTVLAANATERQVFEFGQSWRIQASDTSHFPYLGSETRATFCNEAFVPVFVTDYIGNEASMFSNSTLFEMANTTCWNSEQRLYLSCLYDAAQMESLSAALAAARSIAEAAEAEVSTSNSPPNITMPDIISVTANTTFRVNVMVTDPDGDNVTLSVVSSLSNETVLIEGSQLVWHVGSFSSSSADPNVSVVATDANDAESEWRPVVMYCDCLNGGNCNASTADAGGKTFVFAMCSCPDGYQGSRCEITPCDVTPSVCYINGSCSIASNGSFTCAPCPSGMTGDGRSCVAADPCASGSANCEQQCTTVNTTSYTCSCGTGYTVSSSNSSRCADFDECAAGNHTCKAAQNQTCVNTVGSYSCSCPSGRRLNAAGDCEFVDACATSASNPCGNNSVCVSNAGGYSCFCDVGYSKIDGVCVVPPTTTAPTPSQRPPDNTVFIIVGVGVGAVLLLAAAAAVLMYLRWQSLPQTKEKIFTDTEASGRRPQTPATSLRGQSTGHEGPYRVGSTYTD